MFFFKITVTAVVSCDKILISVMYSHVRVRAYSPARWDCWSSFGWMLFLLPPLAYWCQRELNAGCPGKSHLNDSHSCTVLPAPRRLCFCLS